MIIGFNRKKNEIKQSITEPKFGKIFIKRFLVWLGVFAIIALIVFSQVENYVYNLRWNYINIAKSQIFERAEAVYEADPESDDYMLKQAWLKASLAQYQMLDSNYAEVHIGDKIFATDEDTAYNSLFFGGDDYDMFFIEDMSYLDPVFEAAGIKPENRKDYSANSRFEYDPLFTRVTTYDGSNIKFMPRTQYINRETHTFIPGIVVFEAYGKQYIVDCTPANANTAGYKYEDYGDNFWLKNYIVSYRVDPNLSSKDITTFDVFDPDISTEIYTLMAEDYYKADNEYAWSIGYSPIKDYSFFELAPFTSIAIPVAALILALAVSLIFSFVKYQREKTVWNIFEYRTKTTEAMAHDLKTPLAAIMAYAENLEEVSEEPSKVRDYSKHINEKVSTMDRMIADILALSRGETSRIEVAEEEVSVMELVKLSLMEFPEMKTELKGIDARLKTDKKLLKQAVENLLSNCDRYGDKDSAVDITVAHDSLTITNKTDKTYDDVESLKKPFVKGENSRGAKGTGLGLAIAENNLNILGFKLELVSENGTFKAIVKFK